MPLGNGDVALNVWAEEGGDLLLLLAKSDAWDENCRNLKLGRVRIKLDPNPFAKGSPFRQALHLRRGEVEIVAGPASSQTTCRIWVDANQPVVRVETKSKIPVFQEVILETWRNREYTIKPQKSDLFLGRNGPDPYPMIVYPDVIVPGQDQRILWYHHNRKPANDGYEINMKLQGMGEFASRNLHPLLDRIFGAAILGDTLVSDGPAGLKSAKPAADHRVSIYPLALYPSNPAEWRKQLEFGIKRIEAAGINKSYAAHLRWWGAFWNRSWIDIRDPQAAPSTPAKANAADLTRAYQLCRFMNACASRGAQPMKFNGSLFTVGSKSDPDYRRWGGPGFWFQNGRLLYWPMLAAGDYDLMAPWFRMYREALPFSEARCRKWFNHDGALFGETIMFWGAEPSNHYGWTPFEQRKIPNCESPWLTYYWQNNLEHIAMMLDYFHHTGDITFLGGTLLPHADGVTKFYDLHYPRDAKGKLHFAPAQSLETWHTAVNPLPEVAAIRFLMPQLLALPRKTTTAEQRRRWQRFLAQAPELPVGNKQGQRVVLPAEEFAQQKNRENPELYAVFPYRLFGVGKPELQLARDTFAVRDFRQTFCWAQNDTQAALLGLSEEARDIVTTRGAANQHRGSRFPAFWDAHADWIPDVDHGGNLQLALQFMLMQCEGDRILLLPAWPRDWNVSFKLHAPRQTTVECVYRDGKVESLKVTPASRRKEVEITPDAG
jgi:hypothetical protein